MNFSGLIPICYGLLLVACTALARDEKEHWSFRPVQRPAVPGPGHPIDAFVAAKLRENGLERNTPATRREQIRRVYFDLIGLPPAPQEVAEFMEDDSAGAYERLVDRLLASPQYGERWGRHWLDLVRFAQSNGYERDGEKLLAWRYRDYVIHAFNQDKPYDRFVIEQIAGDELPDGAAEAVVATAFQRLGVFDDEPDDKRMAEFDALDDVLSTTGTTFLGLTLGCARCHDHKFDPIPQTDYYSLLAFFRGVRHPDSAPPSIDSPAFAPLAPPEEVKHWRAWKKANLARLQEQLGKTADAKKRKQIESEIAKIKGDVPYEYTLAVREEGRECPVTHVLNRGNASSPRAEVQPAFPRFLTEKRPRFVPPAADAQSSGRRRVLAEWIAAPDNPLTARVMVNRIWQHHFGEGLVKTTTDFGRAGAAPSHPELLDWLAAEFVDSGWSVKRLHWLILSSETYRQSSRAANVRGQMVDPGNRLLWRQNLRRLEAESIRDNILAIAGTLNSKMSGRGFFPHLTGEVLAGQSRPGLDWDVSSDAEEARRSVYAFIRRTMGVPLFETFDYSNTTSPLPERPTTTVAPQALMLLNDALMQEQARAFARRVAGGDLCRSVERAYQLALQRPPSEMELKTATEFIRRNERSFGSLAGRNTFKLDVANALSTEYFGKLAPWQFLTGPRADWTYHRGIWAPPYEGIRVADRDQGPFALWSGAKVVDGSIETDLLVSSSTESAGLLFRAKSENDKALGYELVIFPKEDRVELRRHADKMQKLAEAPVEIPIGKPFGVAISFSDSTVKVTVANSALSAEGAKIGDAIGVRAWGGPVSLENLQIGAEKVEARSYDASGRALESFCLLLLNLNEVIYID